jgi:hypothetical protein
MAVPDTCRGCMKHVCLLKQQRYETLRLCPTNKRTSADYLSFILHGDYGEPDALFGSYAIVNVVKSRALVEGGNAYRILMRKSLVNRSLERSV